MESLSAPPGRAPPKSASDEVACGIVWRSCGDRSAIGWGSFGHRLGCVSRFLVFLFFQFSDFRVFCIFLFSRFITFSFSRSRSRFRSHHFRFHFLVPTSDELLGSMSTRAMCVAESKGSIIKYWVRSRVIPAFYSYFCASSFLPIARSREVSSIHNLCNNDIVWWSWGDGGGDDAFL